MLSMLMVGVGVVITSAAITYLNQYYAKTVEEKKKADPNAKVLDPKYFGMIVAAVILVVAFFLKRKFKSGLFGDAILGIGAGAIAVLVNAVILMVSEKSGTTQK